MSFSPKINSLHSVQNKLASLSSLNIHSVNDIRPRTPSRRHPEQWHRTHRLVPPLTLQFWTAWTKTIAEPSSLLKMLLKNSSYTLFFLQLFLLWSISNRSHFNGYSHIFRVFTAMIIKKVWPLKKKTFISSKVGDTCQLTPITFSLTLWQWYLPKQGKKYSLFSLSVTRQDCRVQARKELFLTGYVYKFSFWLGE